MFEGLADWLAKISWPLISKAMTSLGVGTVTYVGAETALESALNAAKSSFTSVGGDLLNLMAMTGFFDAMAIMSGGILSGLSWMVLKRFAIQNTGSGT